MPRSDGPPPPDGVPTAPPVPHDADSAVRFNAAMRALRAWSGLTYRQLQRRAEAAGEVLPLSTLAAAMSRTTLPREELVRTFVRACGIDEASVAQWLAARERLAAANRPTTIEPAAGAEGPRTAGAGEAGIAAGSPPGADTGSPPGAGPGDQPSGLRPAATAAPPAAGVRLRPAGTWLRSVGSRLRAAVPPVRPARVAPAVLAVVLVLVALGLGSRLFPGTGGGAPPAARQHPQFVGGGPAAGTLGSTVPAPTPAPATAHPAVENPAGLSGRYRLRVALTGMCVGPGPELFKPSGRDRVLGQHPCTATSPPITVEPVEGGAYRLKLKDPRDGIGCVTVDNGGTEIDLLLAGHLCESGRADQRYFIEPVTAPVAGYRLRSVAGSQYCIGVYEASTAPGVQLISSACQGGKHEVFRFEPA